MPCDVLGHSGSIFVSEFKELKNKLDKHFIFVFIK
jgi:hypothetical protein